MPIYIAVPLTESTAALDEAVEEHIKSPADKYKLQADRGWLIRFDGTTVELSNHIGLTGQEKGIPAPIKSAIIVPVTGYYGRAPMDMWEWLKVRLEE